MNTFLITPGLPRITSNLPHRVISAHRIKAFNHIWFSDSHSLSNLETILHSVLPSSRADDDLIDSNNPSVTDFLDFLGFLVQNISNACFYYFGLLQSKIRKQVTRILHMHSLSMQNSH